tara:strand:+ start:4741 stop:4926 length:186 start_codon:yes stop_codon:yes gene_type:complete
MSDIIKIPAEAKEIIKHKRTGKVYASKVDFDNDVLIPTLTLLWMTLGKTLKSKLLRFLWER